MRNLKKVLTLVLTLAMLLSVMVVGAGAATFGDQESITNKEAVDMCVALNIIGGYEDGTFRPTGNVTRAEMCKMICVALNGGKEPNMGSNLINTFNDVAKDHWAAPYVEYCVSQGIVGGVGGGNFNPNGNITGTQAAKMLLCILGYNASIQGYVGNDFWETKINVDAAQKGLYEGLAEIDASAALTRDQAAQMIWNALNAYEVEYITTLVPGPDGTLTSKITVQDKIDVASKEKITLLEDKYEADTSVTGIMKGYQWNETKGEYTYTLDGVIDTYSTKADFTDLYGMNVKVISAPDPKATTDKVYGIIPWDSKVVATGVLGDVEYDGDKAIKIDGTKYRTDDTAVSLDAYPVNDYTAADVFDGVSHKLDSAQRIEYSFSAIDNDGDGEVDCFVTYPFTVAKVSYVGSGSFNVAANDDMDVVATQYNFDDVNAYDGMAKDDYVKIVDGDNTADGNDTFTKISDIVEGKVTSTKSGSAMIDGNWYDYDSTEITDIALSSTYKLVMVNGYVCAHETITTGADVSDYAVVMEASKAAGVDGNRVKLLFSDGKIEIVAADKDYTNTATNAADQLVGKLVTFEIEDGEYKLTSALTVGGDAKEAGFDTILTTTGAGNTYTYASGNESTIGGQRIASDAVVFVKYGTNSDKYKVMTGADLMKYATASVTVTENAYANKNETTGFSSVAMAYVTLAPTVEVHTGNYGYVTSGIGSTKNDKNETVSVLSFWTADGQVTDALADGIVSGVEKGSVITYEKNSDGSYAIKVAKGIKTDSVISYDESAKRIGLAAGGEKKITADTVILNIDSETPKGIEGNQILKAPETATPGVYEKNAYFVATGNDLDVIIIDTKNNLSVMPGAVTATPATSSDVQAALDSATNVTLDASKLDSTDMSGVVPSGSTAQVTSVPASKSGKVILTAKEDSNVVVNTANAESVSVITEPGSTVTLSGVTDKIPTITGKGNVVITKDIDTTTSSTTNGGFANIAVKEATASANGTIAVERGLELSGAGKLTGFSGSLTFANLAERHGSQTVTPCVLTMPGMEADGTLSGKIYVSGETTPRDSIFSDHNTSKTIQSADLDDGNFIIAVPVGNKVEKIVYTFTKDTTVKTYTFTF